MKKIVFIFLSAVLFSGLVNASSPNRKNATRKIQVEINQNVELLGFVYFLGYEGKQLEQNDEYLERIPIKRKDWYAYGYDLYQQYKAYEQSENLAVIVGYAENIWLDYFINLFVQLDDFPNARLTSAIAEKDYLKFAPNQDPAEAKKNAERFIQAMNKLYVEVNFKNYLEQNRPKYENALQQVKAGIPAADFIPAMEAFYQSSFNSYTLIPSLTIPTGMGFGVKYTQQGKTKIFNVFGPLGLQKFKNETPLDMGFSDEKRLRELSTHEFGHSFVNPIIDKVPPKLITETEPLFALIKNAMSDQGYPQWQICLYEHFVRAGEVLIAEQLGHKADAENLKTEYIQNRQFIYLPTILEELRKYSKNPATGYLQAVTRAMEKLQAFHQK